MHPAGSRRGRHLGHVESAPRAGWAPKTFQHGQAMLSKEWNPVGMALSVSYHQTGGAIHSHQVVPSTPIR